MTKIHMEYELTPCAYEVNNVSLTSLCPQSDILQAKSLLWGLHRAVPGVGWHVEMKSGVIHIWSSLHQTYGVRLSPWQLGKGYGRIGSYGMELVEQIKAGLHAKK